MTAGKQDPARGGKGGKTQETAVKVAFPVRI
jgi:hypothetical protein